MLLSHSIVREMSQYCQKLPISGNAIKKLILQLCIGALFVVGHGRTGLVSSPPKRPIEDEGYAGWRFEDELCQEVSDFRNGMNQSGHEFQAAIAGLVLFGLPQASRRKSAANLARNAAAAMTRVICQGYMAVPAMPGARLAVIETDIVLCPLETVLERPTQAGHLIPIRASQLGQGRSGALCVVPVLAPDGLTNGRRDHAAIEIATSPAFRLLFHIRNIDHKHCSDLAVRSTETL